MTIAIDIPNAVVQLRELVEHQKIPLQNYSTQVKNYSIEVRALKERIRLLLAKRYGRSSEKLSDDQLELFEGLLSQIDNAPEPTPENEDKWTTVPEHLRRKRGRKALPEDLERIRVEHDLSESEKECLCGSGKMVRMGEEISEQLDIIPAQVRVIQHVRFKYACPKCQEGVSIAPLPPQPIPKSNASPGCLAYITISKYQDALPLHRQESILERSGIQ